MAARTAALAGLSLSIYIFLCYSYLVLELIKPFLKKSTSASQQEGGNNSQHVESPRSLKGQTQLTLIFAQTKQRNKNNKAWQNVTQVAGEQVG